jgi:hypothetical protein
MSLKSWTELSEIVRNFALVIAGSVGVYLGWLRVKAANNQAEAQIRQATLARQDHVAELFNRAAGELAHEKLEVRLAAILIMGQIRREFPDLADPVVKLLTIHLQQNPVSYGDSPVPADVQEIMEIQRDPLEEQQ